MTTFNAHPALYPALTLWGYSGDSCRDAPRPARWETARLAVQAGHFLALHTRRPAPAPEPPADPDLRDTIVGGWVRLRGWQPIVPCPLPQAPGAVAPDVVARRFVSNPSAMPGALRQLIERTVRALHHPDDLPDGVALAIGVPRQPEEWWGYAMSGWLATLTGFEGQSAMRPVPEAPGDRWDLERAMEWLASQPDLDQVRKAFKTSRPEVVKDAVSSLGYDNPSLSDLPTRIVLARLLSLYEVALRRGDKPVIDLVKDVRL
ncbi:hypothetical protein [Streptomyces sp. NPDC015125]|uniref:hypothetical protein n=1 Tax=Streptomyces sp. NPDC015125 TaxID=3364938 RepID=UPI0036FC9AF7